MRLHQMLEECLEKMRRTNPHRLQAFDSYYRGLSGGSMGNAGGGVTSMFGVGQ